MGGLGEDGVAGARVASRRYHFHGPGLLYILTTIVLVLGAINGQNNLLFFVFGLAVSGLIVSGVLSGAPLMRLQLSRRIAGEPTVGQAMHVDYELRSSGGWFGTFALVIEESPGRAWQERVPRVSACCEHLPAGGERRVTGVAIPARRGPMELDRVRVWSTFPFGIAKKSVTFSQRTRVYVRPKVAERVPTVFRGGGGRGQDGLLRRRGRGGDEFYALREYVPGDSPRAVAWRPSARAGRPMVRELATYAARQAVIVLALPAPGVERERVISVGAGLARQALEAGMRTGVEVQGLGPIVPARSGRAHLGAIVDALARVEEWTGPGEGSAVEDAVSAGAMPTRVLVTAGGGSGGPGGDGSAGAVVVDALACEDPFVERAAGAGGPGA